MCVVCWVWLWCGRLVGSCELKKIVQEIEVVALYFVVFLWMVCWSVWWHPAESDATTRALLDPRITFLKQT